MPENKKKKIYSCDGKLTHSVKTREEFDPILDDIVKGKNIITYENEAIKRWEKSR